MIAVVKSEREKEKYCCVDINKERKSWKNAEGGEVYITKMSLM